MFAFFRQLGIRWKLALAFMLFSLVPLVGLGGMAYFTSQATIQQKVGLYSEKNLQQISLNLFATLEQIEKLSTLVVLNQELSQQLAVFSTQTTLQKLKTARNIQAQLAQIAVSHPDVRQILLARRHESLLASNTRLLQKERNYFETEAFWNSELYREVVEFHGRGVWKGSVNGQYEDIYLIRQLINPNTTQEAGVLIFAVSRQMLSRVLEQQTQADGSKMFVSDEKRMIIAHSHAEFIGKVVEQANLSAAFQERDAGYFQTETALVVFSATPNKWHIVWEIPQKFLLQDINRLGLMILLAGLTCALLSVAIGVITSTAYSRKICYLVNSASAIAEGDLDQQIELLSEDEVGVLARQFSIMRDAIREKILALQTLNSELDMRVEQRTRELGLANAELAREQYILNCFMDNVPDSIYFKDHDSRFLRLNSALARKFGVKNPAEIIGKSDFDFFPDAQARPKYEMEQEIIRTGQPILALEEPDIGGRWALTTKMPLRDEHGEIIGTFGISRDITPLKVAQQQVEEAYAEIQMLNEQLHQENLRMGAELDVARRLQQMVLPVPEELDKIPGVDIVGYMQPANEVGGDYYDVLHDHDNRLCIGIGDVTGHGLESGVLMLMTQTAIRTLIDRGESDPVVFLNTINRVLYHNIQRMSAERSLTLAIVNYQHGQLRLIGQHEEMLVVRHDGRVERVDTTELGFPIGMVHDIGAWIAEATVALDQGDGIVLYTDGITEAQNAENQLYGLERLCAVISANWRDASAEAVKNAVVDDMRQFVGNAQVYDDVTLVVLKQQ